MKRLLCAIAILVIAGAAWSKAAEVPVKEFKVNPYGKHLTNGEGDLDIEMAIRDEKNGSQLNDVLLKITGAAAYAEGIDGKVFYYTAVPAGLGFDLKYEKDGKSFTRMLTRD